MQMTRDINGSMVSVADFSKWSHVPIRFSLLRDDGHVSQVQSWFCPWAVLLGPTLAPGRSWTPWVGCDAQCGAEVLGASTHGAWQGPGACSAYGVWGC